MDSSLELFPPSLNFYAYKNSVLNFKNTYFMIHNKIYFKQEINKKKMVDISTELTLLTICCFLKLYLHLASLFSYFPNFPLSSVFSQYSYSSATSLKHVSQYSECKKKFVVYSFPLPSHIWIQSSMNSS